MRMNDINEAMNEAMKKVAEEEEKSKPKKARTRREWMEMKKMKQRDSNAMDLDLDRNALDLDRKPQTSPDSKLSSSVLQPLPNSSFVLYSDPNKTIPYEHNLNSEQDQNDEVFSDKENVHMDGTYSPNKIHSPRSTKSEQSSSPPEGQESEPSSPIRTPSPGYLNRILSVDLSNNSTSLSPKVNTVKRFSPNRPTVSQLPFQTLHLQNKLGNLKSEPKQCDNGYDMGGLVTESNPGSKKSAASEAIRPKLKSLSNLDFDADSRGSMDLTPRSRAKPNTIKPKFNLNRNLDLDADSRESTRLSPKTFKQSPKTIRPKFNLDRDSRGSMLSSPRSRPSPKTIRPKFNLDLDDDSRGSMLSSPETIRPSPKTIRPKLNLDLDDDSRGSMSSSPINNKVKRFSPNSDSLSPLKPETTMEEMSESRVTSRLASLTGHLRALTSERKPRDSIETTPVTGSHSGLEQTRENMRRLRRGDKTIKPEILRADSSHQSFDSDIHLERPESSQETVTREEQTQSEMEMSQAQEEIESESDSSEYLSPLSSPEAIITVSSIPKPGIESPMPEAKPSAFSLKRMRSAGRTRLTGEFSDLEINKKARHDSAAGPASDPGVDRSSISSSSSGSSEEGQGYEASTPVHSNNPLNTPLSAVPKHMKQFKNKAVKFVSPAGVTPVQHPDARKIPLNLAELDTSDDPVTTPTPQDFLSSDSPMFKTPQRTPAPKPELKRKRTETKVRGTPQYLAPELVNKQEHGKEVDWWALGVCLYEFMVGCTPFYDETVGLISDRIRTLNFEYPDEEGYRLSQAAMDCISSLLVLDPTDRADDVKLMTDTELTRNIDWENIYEQVPPWVPDPDDEEDTTFFQARNKEQGLNVSDYKRESDEE